MGVTQLEIDIHEGYERSFRVTRPTSRTKISGPMSTAFNDRNHMVSTVRGLFTEVAHATVIVPSCFKLRWGAFAFSTSTPRLLLKVKCLAFSAVPKARLYLAIKIVFASPVSALHCAPLSLGRLIAQSIPLSIPRSTVTLLVGLSVLFCVFSPFVGLAIACVIGLVLFHVTRMSPAVLFVISAPTLFASHLALSTVAAVTGFGFAMKERNSRVILSQDVNLHRQVSFWSGSAGVIAPVRAVVILA